MTPAAVDLASTAIRSPTARGLAKQAVRDPAGLARRLADPKQSVPLMREAGHQVSIRDMAQLGLLFAPIRSGVLSELAIWGARRATGRDRAGGPAAPGIKNVTPPDVPHAGRDGGGSERSSRGSRPPAL
jgi:hypothetical protein